MRHHLAAALSLAATAFSLAALPPRPPAVTPPGDPFEPPAWPAADGAPEIFEHSQEAGPDETLFLVGTNLTRDVLLWGSHPDDPRGKAIPAKVQLAAPGHLALTLPESACDGPVVLSVKNAAGHAAPVVLNAPQPWWSHPAAPAPGTDLRVFGRSLACRPDARKAHVWLAPADAPDAGRWLDATDTGPYALTVPLPKDLKPAAYHLWLHAGRGGAWGWGGPLRIDVREPRAPGRTVTLRPAKDGRPPAIQEALDDLARRGGGTLRLPAGRLPFTGTLRVPSRVTLAGAGRDATTLELQTSPPAAFARFEASGWNIAPGAIHSSGDTMTYTLDIPQTGAWHVWLRYATDMSPWKQDGVSGNTAIQLDNGPLFALDDLPNTGGFGSFKWSRSATLDIKAGRHTLVWRNIKGGGLSLDAFVFTLASSPAAPSDTPFPANAPDTVVLQGEDCHTFSSKDGTLPRSNRAAIWLSADGASLQDLTVLGNAQVNQGIAIRAPEPTAWLSGCAVRRVRLADCEGKQAENCAVYIRNLREGDIRDSELWGRTPLFLSGVRDCAFADNRLVSVTRFGGNAEAAILGRCEPVERCVIERNTVASPPGAEAGGPTARRMIWLATGHGSVSCNWLAHNGVESPGGARQARFGGVAGTDQNVGETILFEGNHRTMFFGPLADADPQSVTLPATLPPTPDNRLGSVKRDQLPRDAEGRETPFWPPDTDDGTGEPPVTEYYVTVFAGPGQGQTRRVTARSGERLALDRPWRVAPRPGSLVAVGTMFHRNLIVGNHTPDGMTGIQLWISCVENIISANTIQRQRKPALFLYANASTLASSMPRTWNRGVSPLFWNLAQGNRADTCSDGALVTSGDAPGLPVEFPRALGNVLRHNTFATSRQNGVIITSRKGETGTDTSASVVGTVVEHNVVRDAPVAYHAAHGTDAVVFRRNHAYAWHPAPPPAAPAVAFQFASPATAYALELNSVEGKVGTKDPTILELKKTWENQP